MLPFFLQAIFIPIWPVSWNFCFTCNGNILMRKNLVNLLERKIFSFFKGKKSHFKNLIRFIFLRYEIVNLLFFFLLMQFNQDLVKWWRLLSNLLLVLHTLFLIMCRPSVTTLIVSFTLIYCNWSKGYWTISQVMIWAQIIAQFI